MYAKEPVLATSIRNSQGADSEKRRHPGAELLDPVKRDIRRFRKIIQDIGIQPQ